MTTRTKSTRRRHVEREVPAVLAQEGVVQRAWVIAAAMPRASRREVIAACIAAGIPHDVAAAQVQRHRYGQKAALKAKALPIRVRNMLANAASKATRELRAD